MLAKLLVVNEIKASGVPVILKYVRVANEFRFIMAGDPFAPNHNQMIEEHEKATSVGFCTVDFF